MTNRIVVVQVPIAIGSDAREDDSSSVAGNIKTKSKNF
jgi:hypothetical protein